MPSKASPSDLQAELARVTAASDFVAGFLAREPGWLAAAAPGLDQPRSAGEYASTATALVGAHTDEAAFMAALRGLRQRELVRIAWRDLAGRALLPVVLEETSALADACIRAARDFAVAGLAARYGEPRSATGDPQQLLVIAMGKLGGRELNFSSDIDLVFLFPEAGETTGPRVIANEEYFTRLGQALIRLLDARTAEGIVFRVDMRLRPFGESGPLVASFAAFEDYLQKHGRDWERYAWVKARPVCGRRHYPALYESLVRPFVYRRYLDYGVFESLRTMKAMIAREVERRDLQDDIKLGPGGIREIEFIVQAHQLIRGGADGQLQTPALQAALPKLAGAKLLPGDVVRELGRSYEFLRRVENRLQMVADAQTHALPADIAGRQRLARAMDCPGWSAFAPVLQAERDAVTRQFASVVFGPAGQAAPAAAGLASLWVPEPDPGTLIQDLAEAGLRSPSALAKQLIGLRGSAYFRRMDETGRRRLTQLLPAMVQQLAHFGAAEDEPVTLERLVRILEAIGGRTAYLALLNENQAALERLVQLCATGEFLARQVAQHPVLLDELLDARVFDVLPDRSQFAAELEARLQHAGDDEERQVDALRLFRRAALFRVATLDLLGRLPLMQVSDRLTEVAELIIEAALAMARRQLDRRHGAPACDEGGGPRPVRVCIVGYGKLGGMELGYASDLDLVCLHDSTGEAQQTRGPKAIDNALYFVRLLQRLVHLLTVSTAAGRLYEVDVRLRPGGKGGLAFTSIDAFDDYQRGEAWTWEHQALLHSRAIAGDAALRERFERLRLAVLVSAVRRESLREEVAAMRERMRAEHAQPAEGEFDLKQDRGGIADIEFLAQYWVLRHGERYPPLLMFPDTIRQLESLGSAALVPQPWIDRLVDAYRRYRQAAHRRALDRLPARLPAGAFAGLRAGIARLWEAVMVAGGEPPSL